MTNVDCERDGHCLHEGTAFGTWWCCKCEKYIETGTIAERLHFYEEVNK